MVVLMSTPCTAPYLGTTIGFALAGSPLDIFAILIAVATGISLPYFLFLAIPNISVFVPKPGPWMEKLEQWMNFLLFLTIFWLLSILWSQIGAWPVFRLSGSLLVFWTLIWFRKKVTEHIETNEPEEEIKQGAQRIVRRFFWLLSFLLFALAVWDIRSNFVAAQNNSTKTQLNLPQISEEIKQGNIVLVNVGASWCLTCTYNDYIVFGNLSVKKLMNHYHIKVINIDWTNYNSEILQFMERFGRRGIPFSILFSPNIPEGMVLPEIMTEREFSEILRSVGEEK